MNVNFDSVVDAILDSAPSESPEDVYNSKEEKGKVETKAEAEFLLAGIETMMDHKEVIGVLKGMGSNGRRAK